MWKELYPSGAALDVLQHKHVFLSRVAKRGDAYGDTIQSKPIMYALPSGRSAKIATVLSSTGPIGPTKSVKFVGELASDYAGTWIDELTMKKASSDRGAFVAARKTEVDGLIKQLGNSMAHALYRDGSGSLSYGNGSWTITGNVITLAQKADTKFFNVGMHLDFSSNVSGVPTALRALAATYRVVVTAIDEDAGTVTCALDANGASVTNISTYYTSLANTDFIHAADDFYGSAGQKIKGLAAWIPLTAPGSTAFWGVDRTPHVTRLAGHRLDDSTAPVEDSILVLAEKMHERGATPDSCYISPRQFTKAVKRLNAKVEYSDAGGTVKYGFSNFRVETSAGSVQVFPDPDCPENRGYLLKQDTWVIRHLGLPEVVTTDGLSMLRRSGLDEVEIRARYYAQLMCDNPGENGVFSCS